MNAETIRAGLPRILVRAFSCWLSLLALALGCGGSDNHAPPLITTTTSLTASPVSVVSGAAVTLTAAVEYAPAETASGTVDFSDNGESLGSASLDPEGVGSLKTTTLAVGTHSLTAAYLGNSTTSSSTSPAVTVTVTAKAGAIEDTALRIAVSQDRAEQDPRKVAIGLNRAELGCAEPANVEIEHNHDGTWSLRCALLPAAAGSAWFTDESGLEYLMVEATGSY